MREDDRIYLMDLASNLERVLMSIFSDISASVDKRGYIVIHRISIKHTVTEFATDAILSARDTGSINGLLNVLIDELLMGVKSDIMEGVTQ